MRESNRQNGRVKVNEIAKVVGVTKLGGHTYMRESNRPNGQIRVNENVKDVRVSELG